MEIRGTADATGGFKGWALDYGHNEDPGTWYLVAENRQPVRNDVLATLNLRTVPNGVIFLRLRIAGPNGATAEKIIRLVVQLPNPPTEIPPTEVPPTPVPTATPTATPVPPTEIPPTEPPTATPTPTEIPPTETETPSPSPTPSETPTLSPP